VYTGKGKEFAKATSEMTDLTPSSPSLTSRVYNRDEPPIFGTRK